MTQHTPGPFGARGPSAPTANTPEGGDYAITDAAGNIIAEVFHRSGEHTTHPARENALLFKAAPKMLATLRRVAARCPTDHENYTIASIGDAARSVIAEATGVTL
jgi:hypothetical protein